jgi:hypothetical protein
MVSAFQHRPIRHRSWISINRNSAIISGGTSVQNPFAAFRRCGWLAIAVILIAGCARNADDHAPYRRLQSVQVLQGPDEIWVFVDEVEFHWRGDMASPNWIHNTVDIHVYVIGREGVHGEFHLPPAPVDTINPNITALFFWNGSLHVTPTASLRHPPELYFWSNHEFVAAESSDLAELNDRSGLLSKNPQEKVAALDELSSQVGWSVLYRGDASIPPTIGRIGPAEIRIRSDSQNGPTEVIIESLSGMPDWDLRVRPQAQ